MVTPHFNMSERIWEDNIFCPTVGASAVQAEKNVRKMSQQNVDITSLMQLRTNDAKEFFCGLGAAMINVTVTYPINKVIFRQILEGVPANTATQQLKKEGVRLLYRGILPPLCQKAICLSLMFSLYEGCKQRLYLFTDNRTFVRFFAANFAGTCEAFLMPLERVQTLLQDWRYHSRFKNTPHAFGILFRQYGITEFYRGLGPIIFRNGMSNALFFTLREQSEQMLHSENSFILSFVSGAVIGGVTSTIFYPLNVIKTHMHSKLGADCKTFMKCIQEVYVARDRSIKNIYKGVHLNFIRSFISWGVINVSYVTLKKFLF